MRSTIKIQALLSTTSFLLIALFANNAAAKGLNVTALVDAKACISSPVQCTQTGHTSEPSNPTNNNPVIINFQVLNDAGNPILISRESVRIINFFRPAGGASVEIFDCGTSCNGSAGPGNYIYYVKPVSDYPWKTGMYSVQVEVKSGSNIGYALVHIAIP